MAYGYFKDSPRRRASAKAFCDKTFNIAKTPNFDGKQLGHISIVYKIFD